MDLIDAIPFGMENAISRTELARLTCISDRKLRDLIKEANADLIREGVAILSSSSVRGYWKTRDREEMKRYLAESNRRIRSIFENDEPIRKYLSESQMQMSFF